MFSVHLPREILLGRFLGRLSLLKPVEFTRFVELRFGSDTPSALKKMLLQCHPDKCRTNGTIKSEWCQAITLIIKVLNHIKDMQEMPDDVIDTLHELQKILLHIESDPVPWYDVAPSEYQMVVDRLHNPSAHSKVQPLEPEPAHVSTSDPSSVCAQGGFESKQLPQPCLVCRKFEDIVNILGSPAPRLELAKLAWIHGTCDNIFTRLGSLPGGAPLKGCKRSKTNNVDHKHGTYLRRLKPEEYIKIREPQTSVRHEPVVQMKGRCHARQTRSKTNKA